MTILKFLLNDTFVFFNSNWRGWSSPTQIRSEMYKSLHGGQFDENSLKFLEIYLMQNAVETGQKTSPPLADLR